MFVLGLTGSIGMGKSTCANMFRRLGVPVHDADAVVHAALAPGGGAAKRVAEMFPETVKQSAINRKSLGAIVFSDPARLAALEATLHPIAAASAEHFLRRHALAHTDLVVLDIPLLFETGGQDRVDAVLVVSVPAFLQRQRVLSRPGMNLTQFELICGNQMPDREKRAMAEFVISTGLGKSDTVAAVIQLTRVLRNAKGFAWAPGRVGRKKETG